MKIELQRLVDGIWYIYGKYDMSKTHDATAFGEAVSELAKHFDIRTVVSYTDNENGRNAALNGGRGSGQTVRRITELYENKIADIKANCDFAIEGRDVKIMELEKLNSNQAESLRITMLEEEKKGKRIEELEQQIEKMKCCQNCKNLLSLAYGEFSCDLYGECNHCSKWEIKEK